MKDVRFWQAKRPKKPPPRGGRTNARRVMYSSARM